MFLSKPHLPLYRAEPYKRFTIFTSMAVSFNISIQTGVLNLHKEEATSIQLHSSEFIHAFIKYFSYFLLLSLTKSWINNNEI